MSEVNTLLFSSVTWRSLLDGVLLDASNLVILGVPLTEDSDSEVELEQLAGTSLGKIKISDTIFQR